MKYPDKLNSSNPMNSPSTATRQVGLGDALTKVFAPVAKIVGKSGCAGCRRRAQKLNRMVPNINPFAK